MRSFMILILSLFIGTQLTAQEKTNSKVQESTIEVDGVCGMCKSRIENAALIKGVKRVEWNRDKHLLTVWFKPDVVTLDQVRQKIADAGHDTDTIKASEEAYSKVHKCCKYRTDTNH